MLVDPINKCMLIFHIAVRVMLLADTTLKRRRRRRVDLFTERTKFFGVCVFAESFFFWRESNFS